MHVDLQIMMRQLILLFFMAGIALAQITVEELGRFGGREVLADPVAIAISDDGRVFVCDRSANRIVVFDLRGNYLRDLGGFGWQVEQFDEPMDIWVRGALNFFVADYQNQRVQRFNRKLNYIAEFRSSDGYEPRFQFREVRSAAWSPQGDLFILDAGEDKVVKFNPRQNGEASFGSIESGAGQLREPVQLELTSTHTVLVSDAAARSVFVFDYFGNFIRKITNPNFIKPQGLAVDFKDRIYLSDTEAKQIFVFDGFGREQAKIGSVGGTLLKEPRDCAVMRAADGNLHAYILNGREVLIARLNLNEAKE
jgi:DNA-binding beta-propeller fold protein YncE